MPIDALAVGEHRDTARHGSIPCGALHGGSIARWGFLFSVVKLGIRWKGKKGKCWEIVREICKARSTDCFTCPRKNLEGVNAQAGHCWPVGHVGSNNTLSWDTRQIRLQCSRCNGPGEGEQAIFKARLEKELGKKTVAALEARRWKIDAVKDWDALMVDLTAQLSHFPGGDN